MRRYHENIPRANIILLIFDLEKALPINTVMNYKIQLLMHFTKGDFL